ncbi:cytochrome ubiquinol oxidase subunit I [Rubrobacter naiadicus]|uniref:cytochrome ubiquinol oxidase subunit I n=1 Tax=Rubrobacter naiadicus TaxID=1392641 RepID=UPI002360AA50|nr:cytochrome ubiquinol oxidase subunit I [Rubrobacter naiadicus]
MPIGDLNVPVIGKNVVIATLVQTHVLIATFILGSALIAPTAEYLGMITKQKRYERFARNLARFIVLLFASGGALAIAFVLALITLFPVFFSYLQNIFFWVFIFEAFLFLGVIIVIYAWYNTWDKLAYRKTVHIVFGLVAGGVGLVQMTMIDVVASYMLTPSEAPIQDVARTYLDPTFIPLNMHRFVGNFSYVGFLIAGWAGWRYLRSTKQEDREYYDWMGHWGLLWGFGFMLLQPVIGYGYLKAIREASPKAFDVMMLGNEAWHFNLLMLLLAILGISSVAYFVHKLRFAIKPMETTRKITIGALGFTALFSILNVIPFTGNIAPQVGLVFGNSQIPLGAMYPWKFIGLIGLMLVGFVAVGLYLKASATGFHWGRASRWSQYMLMVCAVTIVLTMIDMGSARESARRLDNNPGYLINGCITLNQKITPKTCPAGDSLVKGVKNNGGSAVPGSSGK